MHYTSMILNVSIYTDKISSSLAQIIRTLLHTNDPSYLPSLDPTAATLLLARLQDNRVRLSLAV